MKYLIRSVKYFLWFSVLMCLILTILAVTGTIESDPSKMFRGGTKAIWQIFVLFAVLASIYPFSAFMKKDTLIPGEYSEIRDRIISLMGEKGYVLEKEDGEDMTFRLRSKAIAAFRIFEDRITLTRQSGGFVMEGLRKDVVRISGFLEFKMKADDEYSKS